MIRLAPIAILALLALGCRERGRSTSDSGAGTSSTTSRDTTMAASTSSFAIISTAFTPNGAIPSRYTCEGSDTSPPVSWSGTPAGTKSVAMIVDDPDAPDPAKPQRVYVHWVVYGLPSTGTLPENASKQGMPQGSIQGKNDWGKEQYGGPCPPIGRHRYFFKLYALDTEPSFVSPPTKKELEQAMQGHILGQAELIGTYQKAAA